MLFKGQELLPYTVLCLASLFPLSGSYQCSAEQWRAPADFWVSLSNALFSDILSDTFQLPQSPCTLTPHLNSSSPLGHFQHTLPLLQFMNSLKVTRLFFISQGKLSLLSIPQFLEKPVSYILSCLRYLAWKNKSSLFTPCWPEVPVGHWVVTD